MTDPAPLRAGIAYMDEHIADAQAKSNSLGQLISPSSRLLTQKELDTNLAIFRQQHAHQEAIYRARKIREQMDFFLRNYASSS